MFGQQASVVSIATRNDWVAPENGAFSETWRNHGFSREAFLLRTS
jgi:hypothetical protein